jgi:hypothetical protein
MRLIRACLFEAPDHVFQITGNVGEILNRIAYGPRKQHRRIGSPFAVSKVICREAFRAGKT